MQARVGSDRIFAKDQLLHGRLVAFPTETVYGLGAHALDAAAVARIFEAKGRPHFDPLIVHVHNLKALSPLIADFPSLAERLGKAFWPGPLTLVLPKTPIVPDLVTAGLPTVAVRIPAHPMALELLELAGVPVAAPSANRFGRLSPTSAEHVAEQLGERIDYILDGGSCNVGVESTVVDLTSDPPRLLRPGGISLEELQSVVGEIALNTWTDAEKTPAAPGMLTKHYAPETRVVRLESLQDFDGDPSKCGLLTLAPVSEAAGFRHVETLSPTGDLREAATNFFAAMRRLDAADIEQIAALTFPNTGLGRALNDRLQRAAQSSEETSEPF